MKTEVRMIGSEPLVVYGDYPLSHWVQKAKFKATLKLMSYIFLALALAIASIELKETTIEGTKVINLAIMMRSNELLMPLAIAEDYVSVIVGVLSAITISAAIITSLATVWSSLNLKLALGNNVRYEITPQYQTYSTSRLAGIIIISTTSALLIDSFIIKLLIMLSLLMKDILANILIMLLLSDEIYEYLYSMPSQVDIPMSTIGEVMEIDVSRLNVNEKDVEVVEYLKEDLL